MLSLSADEAVRRLRAVTRSAASAVEQPELEVIRFNGQVASRSFRLSRTVDRPNNFLPFIIGTIDATSQGCLVFVRYRLFTMTLAFLAFWLMVSFGFGYYLIRYEGLYHYAALSVGVGVVNYAVALLNFQKQVRVSQALLREVLF